MQGWNGESIVAHLDSAVSAPVYGSLESYCLRMIREGAEVKVGN